MITEDYVSFETAKLLKENGYNNPTDSGYLDGDCTSHRFIEFCDEVTQGEWYDAEDTTEYGSILLAPTHQMAMKWLRDEYNIQISPCKTKIGWGFDIFDLNDADITGCKKIYETNMLFSTEHVHSSYEDAVDAGIKYWLEHKLTELC